MPHNRVNRKFAVVMSRDGRSVFTTWQSFAADLRQADVVGIQDIYGHTGPKRP